MTSGQEEMTIAIISPSQKYSSGNDVQKEETSSTSSTVISPPKISIAHAIDPASSNNPPSDNVFIPPNPIKPKISFALFPAMDGPQRISNLVNGQENGSLSKRKKVGLLPGHSPLDWAKLKKSMPTVPIIRNMDMTEVEKHNTESDAWCVLNGAVYNITPYLDFHPGGRKQLLRVMGKDGTELFARFHPWVNYTTLLDRCLVGFIRRK